MRVQAAIQFARRGLPVLLTMAAVSMIGLAYQPDVIEVAIMPLATGGQVDPSAAMLGDDMLLIEMSPVRPDERLWTLVVFDGVTEDHVPTARPIANLREVLEEGARPRYLPQPERGPAWRMYPVLPQLSRGEAKPVADELKEIVLRDGTVRIARAFLLPPGGRGWFVAIVDFLAGRDGGVRPRILGHAYSVDQTLVDAVGGDADSLAQIVRHRGFGGEEVIFERNYRLRDGRWTSGSFAEIFGSPSGDEKEGFPTLDYELEARWMPVELSAFREPFRIPGNTSGPDRRLFEATLKLIREAGSGKIGDPLCLREESGADEEAAEPAGKGGYSHHLSGIFSTKWVSDHSLHPGFAWRVQAWTNEGMPANPWRMVGSAWVQSDGRWKIDVPASEGYRGKHLRVVYAASNPYFRPQDREGHGYAWHDPDQYDIPAFYNAGHRVADTDGGSASGLGELYYAGATMWSRLYWVAGINPIRDEPIKFYYPNTWETCSSDRTQPWSCASADGRIWIIADHGTRAFATAHELGHQLNYEYWNNMLPANSGGSHSTSTCDPNRLGMVLTEAFADFVAAWGGYPSRHVPDASLGDVPWDSSFNIESPSSPPKCLTGWANEGWTARTFWDLHDTRTDGLDILWFVHPGAVLAIYLDNGVSIDGEPRDMRNYRALYRKFASDGHEQFVDDIFLQNRQ